MAARVYLWPVFLITFLMISSPLISAKDITSREISLVKEPNESYYIVKKLPAVIVCQARNAVEIIFSCMGTQIPPTSVEVKDVSNIDPDLIEAEIEVTQADVQNHEGKESFWCECSAVDIDGQPAVTSSKGLVFIAHLKNKFAYEPTSTTAIEGGDVEFHCAPPEGQPKPEIVWRKDRKRIEVEKDPRIVITDKGSLSIQSVTLDDKGMYQCIARNIAGRRESVEARLTVTALAESAEPDVEVSEEADTDRKASGVAKPRATRQSIKTYFTTEPQEKYYATEEKPLLIDCGVVAADILTFRCNGKRMDRTRQTISQGLDNSGNRVIQSQLSITYGDVQAFFTEFGDDQTFQCICVAWFQDTGSPNGWGRLDSSAVLGYVYLAYLGETFQTEPSDVIAGLNSDATLTCEPPKGQPTPWVYWNKDGNRLDPRSSEKYSVNSKGHLTVHSIQYEDAGSYNCLAENSVKSVQSRAGRLTITAEATVTSTVQPESELPTFPSVIPSTPVFLRDFEAEYTLGADGTIAVVCAVVSADQMSVDCGGKRLTAEEYELKSEVHKETGKRLLHATAVITAEKLALNPDDYYCQCTAWYLNEQKSWGRITSSKGYIKQATAGNAYIGDDFVTSAKVEADFETDTELVCQPPSGNPPPKVHWLKDGVRIDFEADSNFVLLETGSLAIEYVRITDEGEYVCVAENEAGVRQSKPIQFTVLGKPDTEVEVTTDITEAETQTIIPDGDETIAKDSDTPTFELEEPVFSQDLEPDYYIVDDESVTLACTVIAAKALLFVCNGEVLQQTAITGYHFTHPQTLKTLRENFFVVTKAMVEAHTGNEPYTCTCRAYYQKEGSAPTDLLQVESSPTFIHISYLDEMFQQEPSDTAVAYLEQVELLCRAPLGQPEPEISWLKDDSPVASNERIRVEDSGNLIIEEFTEDDEGTYACVANNSFSSRTSRQAFVYLAVTGGVTQPYTKPDLETEETTPTETEKLYSGSPYISKDLHSVYYLVKNKPVTIICEAYSVEFITFTCGMQSVHEQETRQREEELILPDGTLSLVQVVEASINVSKTEVENYEPEKEYWCQCYAHYRVPGVEEPQKLSSVKGVVAIAYLKKNFQKEPEDQTIIEGSPLTILCQPPIGNPPPKVTWTRDGEEIEALSITPAGVLIIPEAQFEHSGEYVCVAENDAGKRMSPAVRVEVKAKEGSMPSKGGPKCQKLEQCTAISANAPINGMGITGLSIHSFCADTNAFIHCVDQNLADCNVTMSPPYEDSSADLNEISEWFTQYCNSLVLNSKSLETCDEINRCDFKIGQVTADNATYWCSLIDSFVHCTEFAIKECGLDELETDLEYLHSEAKENYCSSGVHGTEITPEPEGTNESNEVKPEQEGEIESTVPTGGDDGDDDNEDEDNENREGGAEASKEDSGSAASLRTSILLATILQLLNVVTLSWR